MLTLRYVLVVLFNIKGIEHTLGKINKEYENSLLGISSLSGVNMYSTSISMDWCLTKTIETYMTSTETDNYYCR